MSERNAFERAQAEELCRPHISVIQILCAMDWKFLSAADCLERRGSNREVLMPSVLIDVLRQRHFEYKGKSYPLSTNAIEQIMRELSAPRRNEALLAANEQIHDMLTFGVSVTEFLPDGQKHSTTVPIIDWSDIHRNIFHVTEKMEVLSAQGTHTRSLDVVCFVNGIPLVVIAAPKPTDGTQGKSMVEEGIRQCIHKQKLDEISNLFCYSQLLIAVSGSEARFGTVGTERKFWAAWKEEELSDKQIADIKNLPPDKECRDALFADKSPEIREHFEKLWTGPQLADEQDRLLIGLLGRDRLLEFTHSFVLFDSKFGKIVARYQQFFAIRAILARVTKKRPPKHPYGPGRDGGVIWHTTGSGKSFTMVFLTKVLLLHEALKRCRLLVVTDRIALEKQIANTFRRSGVLGTSLSGRRDNNPRARTGRDLARRISRGSERIVFALIDKFHTATRLPACHNSSPDLIVLVDEGHRGHEGEGHERMRKALPQAAYIAFTGTPLLKEDKTQNCFGKIIHAYTMSRAVEDGTVTPLLYEERVSATDLDKKLARRRQSYDSTQRIESIARDIAAHFEQYFRQLSPELKAQLACDSKRSAIRYKRALDKIGKVTSAIVISPPDMREGHAELHEAQLPLVQQWWENTVVADFAGDAQMYENKVVEDFGTEGPPDILIVVDKLLTGFDEPRNAVLYIDKPLKEHNLIQAIARVNRLHESKKHGLLIDYRGILAELDTAMQRYQDLAAKTQGGYEIEDLKGLYSNVSTEYAHLPDLHKKLWAIFAAVENKRDREQLRHLLIPRYKNIIADNGSVSEVDQRQKIREEFYAAFTEFGQCLKLALSTRGFFEDRSFPEELINTYKRDLKFFTELRFQARWDAQETVDVSVYEKQIYSLVEKQVAGSAACDSEGMYIVDGTVRDEAPEDWTDEKTRNETELIRTRIRKSIERNLIDDPYAQAVFSELLQKIIARAEKLFDHPLKQYMLFWEFAEELKICKTEAIPDVLRDKPRARAYFGVFKLVLGDQHFVGLTETQMQTFIDEAIAIDEIVCRAVAEHSLNPSNIEGAIRRMMLPRLYESIGLDTGKAVISHVIKIMRHRLSRNGR